MAKSRKGDSLGRLSRPTLVQSPSLAGAKVVLTHEQIAKLAYEVWLRKGQPKGQDQQNWLEAEVALRQKAVAGS